MTVAAIDAELAGVMLVTEGHGLLDRDERLRHVRGSIDQIETVSGSCDHEERPEDADPRNRVRAAVKYLSHDAAHNTVRDRSRKMTESELE